MLHRASDFTEFLERPNQWKEFKNLRSRRTVGAGNVLNLREMKYKYKILAEKFEGKDTSSTTSAEMRGY